MSSNCSSVRLERGRRRTGSCGPCDRRICHDACQSIPRSVQRARPSPGSKAGSGSGQVPFPPPSPHVRALSPVGTLALQARSLNPAAPGTFAPFGPQAQEALHQENRRSERVFRPADRVQNSAGRPRTALAICYLPKDSESRSISLGNDTFSANSCSPPKRATLPFVPTAAEDVAQVVFFLVPKSTPLP